MQTIILKERCLNDNVLLLPNKNKIFNRGRVAIIYEYEYASAWHDKKKVIAFKKESRLIKYLNKYYPNHKVIFN